MRWSKLPSNDALGPPLRNDYHHLFAQSILGYGWKHNRETVCDINCLNKTLVAHQVVVQKTKNKHIYDNKLNVRSKIKTGKAVQ